MDEPTRKGPVGLVMAGGGARGAYEVGVLAALLPALPAQERPKLIVGTSVGALNAAYIAANAHLSVEALIKAAREVYEGIGWGQILAPPWSLTEFSNLARYLTGAFVTRRCRVPAVLDPSPLEQTIATLIPDFKQIERNIADGHLAGAAVVATSALTYRSVVFHQGGQPQKLSDNRRAIDYAAVELTGEHIRASAAIPAVFPAVHVDTNPGRGWYFDGGTRLNTPIKPALWLGAGRVITIGLNAVPPPAAGPLAGEQQPDLFAGAGQILVGLLADPLAHDVQTLATINQVVRAGGGGPGQELVPYMFVAPPERDTIGRLAAEVFRDRYRGLRLRRNSPELALFGRLIEGDFDPTHGELLSYLFFDPAFFAELIKQGQADGERWLGAPHDAGLWQVGPP
jgi:NTE family protein